MIPADLTQLPLQRWQCSDGCRYLRAAAGRYSCTFWETFPAPIAGWPRMPNRAETLMASRIEGPHSDAPTKPCPQFQEAAP